MTLEDLLAEGHQVCVETNAIPTTMPDQKYQAHVQLCTGNQTLKTFCGTTGRTPGEALENLAHSLVANNITQLDLESMIL